MKKAPCISTDQSEIQEAHTTPEGVEAIVPRPPPFYKEDMMEMTTKPNIQKLADYINQQEEPERFMMVLLTLCKPEKEGETV